MIQSFKYSLIILKKTKGFLASMVIMPLLMILIASFTLAYSNNPMIGIVGDTDGMVYPPNVRVQSISAKEINFFLGSSQGTLVVDRTIDPPIYHSSVPNNPLIEQMISATQTQTSESKLHIRYASGFIFFKLLTSCSMMAVFLVLERKNGILVRIKQSKMGMTKYIIGKVASVIIVYSIANILILTFYYISGFDMGKANFAMLFLLFSITLIISAGIYLFIGSLVKNEGTLWLFSSAILFPLALCSGILFPVATIPRWMKSIASISPQYYLQKSLVEGKIYWIALILFMILSIILGSMGISRMRRKV